DLLGMRRVIADALLDLAVDPAIDLGRGAAADPVIRGGQHGDLGVRGNQETPRVSRSSGEENWTQAGGKKGEKKVGPQRPRRTRRTKNGAPKGAKESSPRSPCPLWFNLFFRFSSSLPRVAAADEEPSHPSLGRSRRRGRGRADCRAARRSRIR